jgi:hypothetical protein|tara:strand:+ start:146 stop:1708 length:1563 start_codon:yes stop_codon:yes gene_type:complete
MDKSLQPLSNEQSIVALKCFIQATRDSGYKGTVSAIAELVDNALQAKAKHIDIFITQPDREVTPGTLEVIVLDDGIGMGKSELKNALRFGGSSRFNDRSGLGRYGMGLPNASLSQSRRVEVWSWKNKLKALHSYLDVDEVIAGSQSSIKVSRPSKLRHNRVNHVSDSGTLIHWTKCDRLDFMRVSTIQRNLAQTLGRMFRHFLWAGVKIRINSDAIQGRDPLHLHANGTLGSASLFSSPTELEIRSNFDDIQNTKLGIVRIKFSELPISKWQSLSNMEKRKMGITNGAGVSVVRKGREIDYGWFFMGKRKENYDDWWRCEIQFDPVLDDIFGITHTKQQIRPHPELRELLEGHLGPIANALNSRARDKHRAEKFNSHSSASETHARKVDHHLKQVNRPSGRLSPREKQFLSTVHATIGPPPSSSGEVEYRIIDGEPSDSAFFTPVVEDGRITILINRQHSFYKSYYGPLMSGNLPPDKAVFLLQLMLIGAGRAELQSSSRNKTSIVKFRDEWSKNLATYL